eukprot:TRINITY_DN576_c0_g1_i11.p1 TRINITY_DN576_c0_g1~~TRINITY_DN576_c0_g1_i11.p1  ORF type:complete len:748 (-),score=177.39 TRINITY_DN576_c0_g1_i11:2053-4296(-)
MFRQISPRSDWFLPKFEGVQPEARRKEIFASVAIPDVEGCGGFEAAYEVWCKYLRQPIDNRLCSVFSGDIADCNLAPFAESSKFNFEPVFSCLEHNAHFTSLTLNSTPLKKSAVKALATLLQCNHTLKQLHLVGCGLDADAIAALCEGISENKFLHLTHLDLGDNHIGDKGIASLASLLGKCPNKFDYLNFHDCGSGKHAVDSLLSAIVEHQLDSLSYLDLTDNKIGTKGIGDLGALVGKSTTLSTLCLSTSVFNSDLACSGTTLKELRLMGSLSPKPTTFTTFSALRMLSLTSCNISSEFVSCGILAKLRLTKLDLHDSVLDADSFVQMCGLLEKADLITSLNLARLEIKTSSKGKQLSDCVAALVNARLPHLLELDLTAHPRTPISKGFLPVLAFAFEHKTLTSLNISGHGIGDACATALARMVQSNTTMRSLQWDENGTTLNGLQLFNMGFQRNHTIVSMPSPIFDLAKEIGKSQSTAEEVQRILAEISAHLALNVDQRHADELALVHKYEAAKEGEKPQTTAAAEKPQAATVAATVETEAKLQAATVAVAAAVENEKQAAVEKSKDAEKQKEATYETPPSAEQPNHDKPKEAGKQKTTEEMPQATGTQAEKPQATETQAEKPQATETQAEKPKEAAETLAEKPKEAEKQKTTEMPQATETQAEKPKEADKLKEPGKPKETEKPIEAEKHTAEKEHKRNVASVKQYSGREASNHALMHSLEAALARMDVKTSLSPAPEPPAEEV